MNLTGYTDERGISPKVDGARRRLPDSGTLILLAGIGVFLFAVALTVRTYMPCPFWDEWQTLSDIANGARPWNWHWLWSQHNEHRIAITRLLVWLDLVAFGGKNISLLAEMYMVQLLQWAAVCYALERSADLPKPIKGIPQGLFGLCLFHPNQAENLTEPFQVSFILCFAVGTLALLAIAFLDRIPGRWRGTVLAGVSLAPLIAATNLSAGLLIGPAVLALAWLKRLSWRALVLLLAIYLLTSIAYLHGWTSDGPSPLAALQSPTKLIAYVLTYFDVSLPLLRWIDPYRIVAALSLTTFLVLLIRAILNPKRISNFEWFCLAECALIVMTASLTALGRVQFGIGQALAGRYRTSAMLYWAAFFSLLQITVWRTWPAKLRAAETLVYASVILWLLPLPFYWKSQTQRSDTLRQACAAVISGHYDAETVRQLNPSLDEVKAAAKILRPLWH